MALWSVVVESVIVVLDCVELGGGAGAGTV